MQTIEGKPSGSCNFTSSGHLVASNVYMNFVSTGNPNTERILSYVIRMKTKYTLKGPETNYSSSLSKLEEKQNNKHKIVKRTND